MNIRNVSIIILLVAMIVWGVKRIDIPNVVAAGKYNVKIGNQKFTVTVGPEQNEIVPQGDKEQWALALLRLMGNDKPTYETMAFLVAWQRCENTEAKFNPLATTQGYPGAEDFNTAHVKNYKSYEDGLNATARTLANGNYPHILTGLLTNDVQLALNNEELATWGTGLGAVQTVYLELVPQPVAQQQVIIQRQVVEQVVPSVAQPQAPTNVRASESLSYVLQGDVGVNVRAALNANNGRMRQFSIQPGEKWSFGHTIAPISALGDLPVVCGPAGCFDGGGWCDLAWMYMSVAQQLGMQTDFPQHLGVDRPFPGILIDENGDGGDLIITNTTDKAVTFTAIESDGVLTVSSN